MKRCGLRPRWGAETTSIKKMERPTEIKSEIENKLVSIQEERAKLDRIWLERENIGYKNRDGEKE